MKTVAAAGVAPVHYMANNAYLAWADADARTELVDLVRDSDFLQFSLPYQPYFKLSTSLVPRVLEAADSEEVVQVIIQLYRHPDMGATEQFISQRVVSVLSPVLQMKM